MRRDSLIDLENLVGVNGDRARKLHERCAGHANKGCSMKLEYREWTINSQPEKKGHHWHAWVEVERGPSEDQDGWQIFHFTDIGYFDTEAAAVERGIAWAQSWLSSNYG